MPRIPGLTEILSLLQTQTEALSQLPRTLSDLNGTVKELTQATTMAHATIASAQRIAERLEELVDELEEPVRALRPGIERVGKVLDDPAVDTVPDTLRRINEDLLPLIHGLRQAQARVGSVAGLLRRRPRDEDGSGDDEARGGCSGPAGDVAPSRRTKSPTASSSRAHVELHSTSGSRIRSKTAICWSKASSCDCIAAIDCRCACTVWAIARSCAADMAPGGLGRV